VAGVLRRGQVGFGESSLHDGDAAFLFADVHEDYHKPSDDVEDVIPVKLQNVARLAFLTSWGLSQMPAQEDEESESADSDR
jgi:hypothetical protein